MPEHEVAFGFIKPDFLSDLSEIEQIIQENGLEIVYRDTVRLSEQAIDHMYQGYRDMHFYPAMKKYLLENDVIVLMVGGRGHIAQEVLSSLKKEGGKDGMIRSRFRKSRRSQEEYNLWQSGQHPDQDRVTVEVTLGNVIHTADTPEEAVKSLQIILGPRFEIMRKKGNLPAELWDLFGEAPPAPEPQVGI